MLLTDGRLQCHLLLSALLEHATVAAAAAAAWANTAFEAEQTVPAS
jgi:hypothetical protein